MPEQGLQTGTITVLFFCTTAGSCSTNDCQHGLTAPLSTDIWRWSRMHLELGCLKGYMILYGCEPRGWRSIAGSRSHVMQRTVLYEHPQPCSRDRAICIHTKSQNFDVESAMQGSLGRAWAAFVPLSLGMGLLPINE
jgi:hypothetical protein